MEPSYEKFIFPVLCLYMLKDRAPIKRDNLREACIKYMNFLQYDLQERFIIRVSNQTSL